MSTNNNNNNNMSDKRQQEIIKIHLKFDNTLQNITILNERLTNLSVIMRHLHIIVNKAKDTFDNHIDFNDIELINAKSEGLLSQIDTVSKFFNASFGDDKKNLYTDAENTLKNLQDIIDKNIEKKVKSVFDIETHQISSDNEEVIKVNNEENNNNKNKKIIEEKKMIEENNNNENQQINFISNQLQDEQVNVNIPETKSVEKTQQHHDNKEEKNNNKKIYDNKSFAAIAAKIPILSDVSKSSTSNNNIIFTTKSTSDNNKTHPNLINEFIEIYDTYMQKHEVTNKTYYNFIFKYCESDKIDNKFHFLVRGIQNAIEIYYILTTSKILCWSTLMQGSCDNCDANKCNATYAYKNPADNGKLTKISIRRLNEINIYARDGLFYYFTKNNENSKDFNNDEICEEMTELVRKALIHLTKQITCEQSSPENKCSFGNSCPFHHKEKFNAEDTEYNYGEAVEKFYFKKFYDDLKNIKNKDDVSKIYKNFNKTKYNYVMYTLGGYQHTKNKIDKSAQ